MRFRLPTRYVHQGYDVVFLKKNYRGEMELMEFSYQKIMETLMKINVIEELRGKLFISGGIVPWIISETDSNRTHGDIDLICKQEDMDLVRQKLKDYNIYAPELDSLTYPQIGEVQDYGVDTYIGGVPVGFYPYEFKNGRITQRSFTPDIIEGKPDLKVKIIDGIDERDYLTTTMLSNGLILGHSTLEMIKATKKKANRSKDRHDIAQIDAIGTDSERQTRVDEAVARMKSTLDERRARRDKMPRGGGDNYDEH